jgi:hypothetical protein
MPCVLAAAHAEPVSASMGTAASRRKASLRPLTCVFGCKGVFGSFLGVVWCCTSAHRVAVGGVMWVFHGTLTYCDS